MTASRLSIHTKFTIISLLQYSDCFQRLGFRVNLRSLFVDWPWRTWNWSREAAWSCILQANLKLEQAHERALLLAGSLKKKIARIPFKLGYSQQGDASKQVWQRLVNWVVANDLPSEEFQWLWDLQVRDEGDPTLSQGLLDPCCSAGYGKVQSPAPSGR